MKNLLTVLIFALSLSSFAQSNDEATIRLIYDEALERGQSYSMLEHLTTKIGARLSGSPGAAQAVAWTKTVMEQYEFDAVWLQPVMVPHWVRGQKEVGGIRLSSGKSIDVHVCALGNAVGTGPSGILASVVEVKKLSELAELGEKNVKGKIVFFNRPMDPKYLDTFAAYGGAGDQRSSGPSEAARFGAAGVIVRSLGSNPEDYPHTGSTVYKSDLPKIPAIAISTNHADLLSKVLAEDKSLKFYFESHCEMLEDVQSYNVVGQIRGSEYPDEIIAIGGHLDSWDLAQGAHDDGAGCIQSIEVLRIFKAIGYKPKRTIRAVMFMNEENGLRGGKQYAEFAKTNKEKHIAAIESDRGGSHPEVLQLGQKLVNRLKLPSEDGSPYLNNMD